MKVAGIRSGRSTGVSRYAGLLADALAGEGVDYTCVDAPLQDWEAHWHLANSSRGSVRQASRHDRPFVVTVHDVVPRTKMLEPVYSRLVYPLVVRRAARVVVHSRLAADLLVRRAGIPPGSVDVIPHPAPAAPALTRAEARAGLGWPDEEQVAVLPGAVRGVKLVAEALAATERSGWRLAVVGEPRERGLVRMAREHGAYVHESPSDGDYQRALLAADCVLVLRRDSVGESNGPLLDALGARRAVLATATGSIPEVAGCAAELCDPDVASIRRGLLALADDGRRLELEMLAASRAADLDWSASARAHRAIFDEVFGG